MSNKTLRFLVFTSIFVAAALAITESAMAQASNSKARRIIVRKAERRLELYSRTKLLKTYEIVLGFSPLGDKAVEGDGKTPEGTFYVFVKNPQSHFTRSLGISYPSTDDARRGLDAGLITRKEYELITRAIKKKQMPLQKTPLGGEIYIHGGGIESDWTDGCIALKDAEALELFKLIAVGAVVEILP